MYSGSHLTDLLKSEFAFNFIRVHKEVKSTVAGKESFGVNGEIKWAKAKIDL